MKINRLIEMTTILLNRGTVTAAELAERFHVSVRTIYRDVDVLSASGVPVFAVQGAGGGISVLDEYSIGRASLDQKEVESIIVALQSMKATKYPDIDGILEKLGAIFKNARNDIISVDFSPWGSNPNENNKFDMIKNAILSYQIIEISYVNGKNERSRRRIAPTHLAFKSYAWYLWGFCYMRREFRMFRLSRIKNTEVTDKFFDRNSLGGMVVHKEPEPERPMQLTNFVLEFNQKALYRMYDMFDDDLIIENPDGTFTLSVNFPEDEWVYGYILGFGPNVKVIKPDHVRELIRGRCLEMAGFYE